MSKAQCGSLSALELRKGSPQRATRDSCITEFVTKNCARQGIEALPPLYHPSKGVCVPHAYLKLQHTSDWQRIIKGSC